MFTDCDGVINLRGSFGFRINSEIVLCYQCPAFDATALTDIDLPGPMSRIRELVLMKSRLSPQITRALWDSRFILKEPDVPCGVVEVKLGKPLPVMPVCFWPRPTDTRTIQAGQPINRTV